MIVGMNLVENSRKKIVDKRSDGLLCRNREITYADMKYRYKKNKEYAQHKIIRPPARKSTKLLQISENNLQLRICYF